MTTSATTADNKIRRMRVISKAMQGKDVEPGIYKYVVNNVRKCCP